MDYRQETIQRAGGRCEYCGQPGHDVHHAGGRRGRLLKDARCTVLLCAKHHIPFAHERVLEFREWFKQALSERYADSMTAKFHGWQPDYAAFREERGLEY